MTHPCPDCDEGVQFIDVASRFDHEHETREVTCERCGGAGELDDGDPTERQLERMNDPERIAEMRERHYGGGDDERQG